MAIKLNNLEIGQIYFGWHKQEEFYLFLRYLGEGKWSPGFSSLYREQMFNASSYEGNYNQIIPYCKITVFPVSGCWSRQKALEVNNFKLQRAQQATENWFELASHLNPNHSWTLESLTNHFLHSWSNPEYWAKKNEETPLNFDWFYNGVAEPSPEKKPIKVTKYRIINCVKDKELYKECPNT